MYGGDTRDTGQQGSRGNCEWSKSEWFWKVMEAKGRERDTNKKSSVRGEFDGVCVLT